MFRFYAKEIEVFDVQGVKMCCYILKYSIILIGKNLYKFVRVLSFLTITNITKHHES